jgi:hypothetical protein
MVETPHGRQPKVGNPVDNTGGAPEHAASFAFGLGTRPAGKLMRIND